MFSEVQLDSLDVPPEDFEVNISVQYAVGLSGNVDSRKILVYFEIYNGKYSQHTLLVWLACTVHGALYSVLMT